MDNLGIVVDQAAANKVYADEIGKVVSKLDEQEKKQALVNAVIRDSAGLVADNAAAGDDAASNFERMDAAIANAKDALGQLFQPAMIVVAQAIADAAVAATEGMKNMAAAGELDKMAFAAENASGIILGMTRELEFLRQEEEALSAAHQKGSADWIDLQADIRATEDQLDTARAAQLEYNRAAIAAAGALSEQDHAQVEAGLSLGHLTSLAGPAAAGLGQVGMSADALKERLAGLKAQSDATISALAGIESSAISRLESAASGAVGVGFGAGKAADIYTENATRIRGQIKAMEDLGLSQDYIKFKSQELADSAASDFTIYTEAAREASRATGGIADSLTDAEQAAKQAFDNIKGMAEGVLSGALNTGVASADSILESMGLREDAINEDARRLADVAVKGWDSPWADYFRTTHPGLFDDMFFGDIKAVAARQLKDFEDGLNPELIDKDMAKERVRRMLLGDQSMAALAQEIASELASEMGIPLQEALAAAQGTLGSGGATGAAGTDAVKSFNDGAQVGLEESNTGGVIVDTTISQLRASYSKLSTAGQDASKVWSSGFMSVIETNLSMPLINLLATLVTPGVMAQIAQRGTLTNAVP